MRFPISLPITAFALALSGCIVGPNYTGAPQAAPRAAAGAGFARADHGGGTVQPPLARWWTSLNDPTLNTLEQLAISANPNLFEAKARLRQARASVRIERANLLPTSSAQLDYAHIRIPNINTGSQNNNSSSNLTDFDFYNVGFDASWEVDLFGGKRRAVEASRATAEAAEANLADTQVSITADVASAYVNLRDRQRRIGLAEESVRRQAQMLTLTAQRFSNGTASRLEVARLQNQVDSTRADVTPLSAERDAYLNALAVLLGREPGSLDDMLEAPAPVPLPPAKVAIGDPAGLLRRRPDIRAAERMLAADTAKIGQAEAARFPKLSFMGIVGLGGTSPADMTHLDDFTAILAPQLSWNFLDFGRNKARIAQARSVREEAEAQYAATVLAALRDAEDSLARFKYRRATVATLARAKRSADEALLLSEQRYRAGTSTLIELLDAQRQQISAEQGLSTAEAGLTGDFVAIQKSLGLGWETGPLL